MKDLILLRRIARTMAVLAILFVSMFALDSFGTGKSFWQQLLDFLGHLIPSYVLIAVLLISWKRELLGGILYVLIGLATTPFVFSHNYAMNESWTASLGVVAMITLPFVVIGLLFLACHKMDKKIKRKAEE
jgi:cytochrome b561